MERIKFRPWGVRGGGPGAPTEFLVNVGTPNERRYGKIDVLGTERGDVVTLRTAGAGGYGDPMARATRPGPAATSGVASFPMEAARTDLRRCQ